MGRDSGKGSTPEMPQRKSSVLPHLPDRAARRFSKTRRGSPLVHSLSTHNYVLDSLTIYQVLEPRGEGGRLVVPAVGIPFIEKAAWAGPGGGPRKALTWIGLAQRV